MIFVGPRICLLLSLLPELSAKISAATHQPWLLPITVRTTDTLQLKLNCSVNLSCRLCPAIHGSSRRGRDTPHRWRQQLIGYRC